jgi:hypothetical protein
MRTIGRGGTGVATTQPAEPGVDARATPDAGSGAQRLVRLASTRVTTTQLGEPGVEVRAPPDAGSGAQLPVSLASTCVTTTQLAEPGERHHGYAFRGVGRHHVRATPVAGSGAQPASLHAAATTRAAPWSRILICVCVCVCACVYVYEVSAFVKSSEVWILDDSVRLHSTLRFLLCVAVTRGLRGRP